MIAMGKNLNVKKHPDNNLPLPEFEGKITGSNRAPDWHDQTIINNKYSTAPERESAAHWRR